MTDFVGWASLGLALFSALGVLYLIFQSLYDVLPSLSFNLQHEGLNTSRSGTVGQSEETMTRNVIYNFTVWNRTSQVQRLQCSFAIPTMRLPNQQGWESLFNEQLFDRTSAQLVDRLGFDVAAGDGRMLAISGDIRPGSRDPVLLEFKIQDNRLGRRHWTRSKDVPCPPFRGPSWNDSAPPGGPPPSFQGG